MRAPALARIAARIPPLIAALSGCGLPPGAGPYLTPVAQVPQPLRAVCMVDAALASLLLPPQTDGRPDTRALAPEAQAEGHATWIGHSGFLLQIGGAAVLVDPMLSDRLQLPASPPRIAAAPRLALDRLDAVLISHEDQDHYDLPSLRALAAAFPGAVLIGPPALRPRAERLGFAKVVELAAWQEHRLGGLRVTATPAVHFGRRGVLGLNPHPAVGWALQGGGLAVFHAGDTARGPVHAEIGRRLGPFDLALVPIGAYAPEGISGDVHARPECALAIAADLRARRAVGMHWGTFALSPEPPAEARGRFLRAARPGGPVPLVLEIGQSLRIKP